MLGADGRALVVYPTSEAGFGVATLTATGLVEPALLGSLLRDPLGLTPLLLADGTRALAWSDNRGQLQGGAQHGRLHFAVEGAPRAARRGRAGDHRARAPPPRAASLAVARAADPLQRRLRRARDARRPPAGARRDRHAHRRRARPSSSSTRPPTRWPPPTASALKVTLRYGAARHPLAADQDRRA